MASLRKEEAGTTAVVAVANLEKEAAIATATTQQLLSQIKII